MVNTINFQAALDSLHSNLDPFSDSHEDQHTPTWNNQPLESDSSNLLKKTSREDHLDVLLAGMDNIGLKLKV